VLRVRLPLILMLVFPLAACSNAPAPTPSPEPQALANVEKTEKTEKTEKAVPTQAPEVPAPPSPPPLPEALASNKADTPAPESVKAKAPPSSPVGTGVAAGAGGAAKEIALPKPKTGVLSPGAANKVLRIGGPPIMKLLDAGAEPRSDLSYALTKGSTQKVQMSMDMVMAMKMGPQTLPSTTIPTMTMLLDMTTADKNPSGEWRIESKLTQVTINPKGAQQEQFAAAMRPQIEAMEGLGMGYWINAKGRVRDVNIDVPKSVPDAAQQMLQGMNQSFESMVAPLPSEPVGLGARWQVVSRMASSGADLLQSAVYTLKARDGGKMTLNVTLSQLAASDTIKPPGMPPEISAQVRSFNSGGSGTSLIDTQHVAPEVGSMTLKTTMNISVRGAGTNDDSSVETQTKVQIGRP
jgi:hypothetical protein